MKGDGPGQFDLPHSIAIDDDLVYVADRENARIQIFDLNGRYLREWKLGHPYGLFITPDHFIYMSDAIAGSSAYWTDRRQTKAGISIHT